MEFNRGGTPDVPDPDIPDAEKLSTWERLLDKGEGVFRQFFPGERLPVRDSADSDTYDVINDYEWRKMGLVALEECANGQLPPYEDPGIFPDQDN